MRDTFGRRSGAVAVVALTMATMAALAALTESGIVGPAALVPAFAAGGFVIGLTLYAWGT
jgi:hypothetical protein